MYSRIMKNSVLKRVTFCPSRWLTREVWSGAFISLLVHTLIILVAIFLAYTVPSRPAKIIEIDFSIVQGTGTSEGSVKGSLSADKTITRTHVSPRKSIQTAQFSRNTYASIEQKKPTARFPILTSTALSDGAATRAVPETYDNRVITGDFPPRQGTVSENSVGFGTHGAINARGTGSADGFGNGSGYGGSPLRKGKDYTYIRDAVMKNIKYPEQAKRMGIEGKTLLSFIVLEDGTTSMITVLKSSGHSLLDESAKTAISRTIVPRKVTHRVVVHLPVAYKLHITNAER